ncbi:MAG: hypothetical protein GY730_03420 [bacterium]|nr:hypothetical protein [bacterium]
MDYFQITRRHYDLIIKQVLTNYPQESGGFVGGKDGLIKGVLPVHNQYLFARHDTFAITSNDLLRAYSFFEKHGLDYYGLYHSHPKGVPYPSKQDLKSRQRYHFIIGLRNPEYPVFYAFEVQGDDIIRVPLDVIENTGFSSIDIHSGKNKKDKKFGNFNKVKSLQEEADDLNTMIENIKQNKPRYKKRRPGHNGKSSFSTDA